MVYWLSMPGSFLLGSIPCAYLLVKCRTGKDIRRSGSGNVGTMNTVPLLGWPGALLVFILDAGKGAGAVWLCQAVGSNSSLGLLLAVAGHMYSPWLGFQGGKGLATALGGVLAGGQWLPAVCFGLAWLPVYLGGSRKMDRANLAGAMGIGVLALFSRPPDWSLLLLALLIAIRHWRPAFSIAIRSGRGI